ncbi:MAG: TetR/AcrR family transcriptional regulator [Omnitrophica WOR_2 bacterium]
MSPRPDVSDERKSQIVGAAVEVFTEKGFDEARMDDIAEKTGLSKGTLYLYFKNKDDLIMAILDRIFQQEFSKLERLNRGDLSAVEAVRDFTQLMASEIGALLRLIPIIYQFLALAFRNRYVQHALQQYLNRYMDFLIPLIQRGIDAGEFRAVDPREVAIAIGAIVEGTILLWVYDRKAIDPERHIQSGIHLLLEGILVRVS